MFDYEKETFEPFEDDTVVEVEMRMLSKLNMATKMPEGFVDRLENSEDLHKEDVSYLKWVVDEHTNQNFMEYTELGEGVKLGYIVSLVFNSISDEDMMSWEEFKKEAEGESFIDSDSLGVQ